MSSQFIQKSFDQFAEKTTTTSVPDMVKLGEINNGYDFIQGKSLGSYKFQIGIRHVKSPEMESLIFDVKLNTPQWIFIRSGSMIIKAGVHKIELKANENYTNVLGHSRIGNTSIDLGLEESVFYVLTPSQLEMICDADTLKIRVTGESHADFEGPMLDNFQLMCKQFYNNFYDGSKYTDSLQVQVKSGACFVATAALGNYNHPVVIDLRVFRDNWLAKREWGVQFIDWYYKEGPKMASYISKSESMKRIAFVVIIKPLHIVSKILR